MSLGNIYTYICGVIHNQVKNILFTAKKIQAMVHELFYDDENQVLVLRYNSHFQLIDVEPVLFSAKYFLISVNNTISIIYKINFVILGVPIYRSHVFTRKEK